MSPIIPTNSIQKVFDDAEAEFKKITGHDHKSEGDLSLAEIIDILDHRLESHDSDEQKKKDRTKAVVKTVLQGLQVLNGVAAQAASSLLPQSNVCFNAVGWLLTLPTKIQELYDGIHELFEEINSYLITFKILKRVDEHSGLVAQELIDSTGGIMTCFVRIIAGCYDAWRPRHKFKGRCKLAFKAVFADEGANVQASLDEFKRLLERQQALTGVVTLEAVLNADKDLSDVKRITEAVNLAVLSTRDTVEETLTVVKNTDRGIDALAREAADRRSKESTSKDKEEILKAMDLDEGNGKAAFEEQESILRAVARDTLPGSGQWLKDLPAYQKWRESDSADQILVLCGKPGCGKHYLAAQTARSLQEQGTDDLQCLVGYYHFAKSQFNAKGRSLGLESVARALRIMAWQVASNHLPYRRELLSSCRADPKLFRERAPSLEKLWKALKLASKSNGSNHSFFLIFDGFHRIEYSTAQTLSKILKLDDAGSLEATDQSRLRVLLTSINEGLPNIEKFALVKENPVIMVNKYNHPDISSFITSQLKDNAEGHVFDSLNLLIETDGDEELTRVFHEDFPDAVDGVFENVIAKLKRVRRVIEDSADDAVAQIKVILADKSHSDRAKVAESEIARLNDSLNPKEIDQLNTALPWLVYGPPINSPDMLKAVFAAMEVPWISGLQTFIDKIKDRNKYGGILRIQKEFGRWIVKLDDDVAEYLANQGQSDDVEVAEKDHDQASVTLTITFNRASRANMKTFFSNFDENILSELRGFQALEEQHSRAGIHVDHNQSYSTIVEQCLAVLTDEPEDETEDLLIYSIQCFPHCLKAYDRISNTSGTKPPIFRNKKKILRSLVSMLTDVHLTVRVWAKARDYPPFHLLGDIENVEAIGGWLYDETTKQELKPRHRRRLERLLADHPGKGEFWEPLTLEIARHWLLKVDSLYPGPEDTRDAFIWISHYLRIREQLSQQSKEEMLSEDALEPKGHLSRTESDTDGEVAAGNPRPDKFSTFYDLFSGTEIAKAAAWVQETLEVEKKGVYWYLRLADTYQSIKAHDETLTLLKEAIDRYPRSWILHKRLSDVYFNKHALGKAIALGKAMKHLEITIDILRNGASPNDRLTCHIALAYAQMDLGLTDQAIANLSDALEINARNYAVRARLLEVLGDIGRNDEVLTFLRSAQENGSTMEGLNELSHMFYRMAKVRDWDSITKLCTTMNRCGEGSLLLESIRHAMTCAQDQPLLDKRLLGILMAHEASAISLSAPRDEASQLRVFEKRGVALKFMTGIVEIEDDWPWLYLNTRRAFYCYQRFLASGSQESLQQIEEISDLLAMSDDMYTKAFLVRCKLHQGQKQEAKKHLTNQMKDAFGILSNRDADDDWFGYLKMARIFEKLDEDENCLTVLSLIRPSAPKLDRREMSGSTEELADDDSDSRKEASEQFSMPALDRSWGSCSGCLKPLRFGGFWSTCRICPYAFFCAECRDALRNESLGQDWCHPDHVESFIEISKWPSDDWSPGEDKVRIGGWSRPDGEVVDIDDWLNGIRKEWGIDEVVKYDRHVAEKVDQEASSEVDSAKSVSEGNEPKA